MRRRRVLRLARTSGAVVLLAVSAAAGYFFLVYPDQGGPGDGARIAIEIPRGAGPATVGRVVERAGLVRSSSLFAFYVRVTGATPRLRWGRRVVRNDATPREILERISRPAPGGVVRVTIPEGFDLTDVARALSEAGVLEEAELLDAARDALLLRQLGIRADSAEGYLFPDTYDIRASTDPRRANAVVTMMVQTFHRRTLHTLADLEPAARHDVVILGSIVEREARLAPERPRIAGVFQNRLRLPDFVPHILQADPTVAYGCRLRPHLGTCRDFDGRLRRRHLQDPTNAYNTYVHEGLPPGPICNPGLASLAAARHPLETDELYFVAERDGRHAFARTLEEHNRNVRRLRRR